MVKKINPLAPPNFSEIKKRYSQFLKEAKKRLLFTLYFFIGATLIGFVFYEQIIKFLVKALSLEGINIVFTAPFQFFNLSISCGIATGLITVFPILLYQILSFLKPALKRKEFRMVTKFLPFSLILFLIGFFFGAILMKWQIELLIAKSLTLGIGNVLDITKLLSTILLTSSLMGVGFQFPIVLLLLMRLRIIKRQELAKKRKWIYLGSFIFAIFLPADSIIVDVFLSLPLIVLFEITLFINWALERRKK